MFSVKSVLHSVLIMSGEQVQNMEFLARVRYSADDIGPGKFIVFVSDVTSLGELVPAFTKVSSRNYHGMTCLRSLADTRWACKKALKILRSNANCEMVYLVVNSDELQRPVEKTKTATLLQTTAYWDEMFSPLMNATMDQKSRIRYIPPWQPVSLTRESYRNMLDCIYEAWLKLGFPHNSYLDWPFHRDSFYFDRKTLLCRPQNATGPMPKNFGHCFIGRLGMKTPPDCVAHQEMFPGFEHHITPTGMVTWLLMVRMSEPDGLLRLFDIQISDGGHRVDSNHRMHIYHLSGYWAKYPDELPSFVYRYGTEGRPERLNYSSKSD